MAGANRHDSKLLEATIDNIVIIRPEVTAEKPQNICLDAAYVGSEEMLKAHHYTPHIRPRGEEKKEIKKNPAFKARRWVVEVTHSFMNRFRKLLIRFEKKDENYLALGYSSADSKAPTVTATDSVTMGASIYDDKQAQQLHRLKNSR